MHPDVTEWLSKAEGDWKAANRLGEDEDALYDAVAFHAQQCAEKYLKAKLVQTNVGFPKTHSLGALLNLVLPVEPTWETLRNELDLLTAQAVEVRYPGYSADRSDAQRALETARRVRALVRSSLGIASEPSDPETRAAESR